MVSLRTNILALGTLLGSALLGSSGLYAAPAREALVIGNGSYANLPPLTACLLSAHAVAAALKALDFNVVEREDASSGATDGAISEFAKQLAGAPGSAAFVYVCGYATAFNDRPFLLPASASISRPADVLTQGVLAKSLLDVMTRGGIGAAVVAMDLVPAPGAPATLGLDALAQVSMADSLGLVAVSQPRPPNAPTSLATVLTINLKGPEVQVAPLLAAVQQQLGGNTVVTLAALHQPVNPGYLAGAPPPPALKQAAVSPPAAPPPAPSPPAAPVVVAPTPVPADEDMTDADRRRIQAALAKLGYYDGVVDGIFGPDTRAAIRRYQHELGVAMTGKLTAAQATRLAGGQ